MKPPLTYFGGKTRLAEQISAAFPAHEHYVEPYAGSLAVLLAKPRSRMETVNDLDGDLMTFWRVLRDQPDELTRVCALTPHARAEQLEAYALGEVPDDLERARRVWVLLTQGRAGVMRNTGWRHFSRSAPRCCGATGRRSRRCSTTSRPDVMKAPGVLPGAFISSASRVPRGGCRTGPADLRRPSRARTAR
ncbi:DNA adenine methylase [Amycolatopsis sp. NPDC049159]|uniref:DNA adenine methylase n=1 Tax=Amycolatopsis sp. NPDC049159 TaxID=3157210 RepID=UPI0033FADB8D